MSDGLDRHNLRVLSGEIRAIAKRVDRIRCDSDQPTSAVFEQLQEIADRLDAIAAERPPARCFAVDPSAQPQERRQRAAETSSDPAVGAVITDIVRQVAELPDRTSPDEWPEAMLVTHAELEGILGAALGRLQRERDEIAKLNTLATEEWADKIACEQERDALKARLVEVQNQLDYWLATDAEDRDENTRSVRSLATMLGWGTGIPPQDVLERDLAAVLADVARLRHLAHQLVEAAQVTVKFLDNVAWNDNWSETTGVNAQHALEVAIEGLAALKETKP